VTGFSAILLAAGESRRMGGANELPLDFGGEALERRCARTLLAAQLRERVVVTGHEAERVRAELAGLALHIVFNGGYAGGQMSSVHTGFRVRRVSRLPPRRRGAERWRDRK
jgi:molybdenum cofactor cytidylyltransferase